MKKSVLRILVPGAIALCALMCLPSCQPQANTAGEEKAADETVFVPDSAFAQIDSLADFLIGELQQGKPEDFANRLESQTSAMKSYWHFNHQGENEEQMAETVCGELKALADKLAEGSTVDMERCGQLRCAVAQYHTAKVYCDENRGNPLYQAEMSDWLQLENELSNFYGELATLANWDGTISKVIASGSRVFVAESRDDDYSQLKKGGNFAGSDDMTIAEARANLIQELEDAKSLEDDLVDDPNFKKTLQSMRERADRIVPLLDEWLAARAELGNAEAIPEAHTAHFIEKMGQQIMKMIE